MFFKNTAPNLLLSFCLVTAAHASSITPGQVAALQNIGFTTILVSDGSNPLLGPTSGNSLVFEGTVLATNTPVLANVSFMVALAGVGTFVSSLSTTIQCNSFGNCQNNFLGDINVPLNIYHPIAGTVTFTFNGASSGPFAFSPL